MYDDPFDPDPRGDRIFAIQMLVAILLAAAGILYTAFYGG